MYIGIQKCPLEYIRSTYTAAWCTPQVVPSDYDKSGWGDCSWQGCLSLGVCLGYLLSSSLQKHTGVGVPEVDRSLGVVSLGPEWCKEGW